MNIIFIVTFFTFLSFGQSFEPAQQCIKAFFKSAQSLDVEIQENCFGTKFDKDYSTLISALDKEDTQLFINTIKNMGKDIVSSCPVLEIMELIDIIKNKIKDQSIFIDIIKKTTGSLKIIIKEMNKETHTGESIGTTAGEVIYIWIKEKKLRLNRYGQLHSDTLVILKGILKGLGNNESSTLCHDAIIENSPEVIEIIRDFIRSILEGKDFIDALQKALMQFFTIIDITENCRLFELIGTLKNIITIEGLKQLVVRLQNNIPNLIIIAKKIIGAVIAKDDNEVGVNIGKAIKIILDFYVN